MRLLTFSRSASRLTSLSEGTSAGLVNRTSDGCGVSPTAGCNATSPGITITETPRFPIASRIAIFKTRGI